MKHFSKKFWLLELLIVAAIIALAAALFMPRAKAQPYITNSTAASGPYQYNSAFVNPAAVQQTISRQQAAGILAGIIPASAVNYVLVTNPWPTNIYTVAPTLIATSGTNITGTATNSIVSVISTSLTNFVLSVYITNQPIHWMSIGH